jgi:transglutaminase-like putative cysteine protease
MLEPHYPDPADRLGSWARGFVRSNPTNTLALLSDLNSGVRAWISYQSRETEGTQTPIETLNRGWGSCRDLAVLLIEAARSLGFGARVVTGYLYNASADSLAASTIGAGTTHAWADIYLPGAGWIAYDPTNGTIGGRDLIRVAVTRDISQAVPVAGSFVGMTDDYLGLTVDVAVVSESPGQAGAGGRA